ncbi:MAG: surface lipoprotein assembly modifier [Acidiferrobacterales bacterium]
MRIFKKIIILFIIWGISATAMADAKNDQIQQLINNKQYQKAYTMAEKLMAARAGELEFDYLYAQAASGTGKTSEAIFAMQRVIASKPDHYQARLKLAQLYLIQENSDAAYLEINYLMQLQPPPKIHAQAMLTLNKIKGQQTRYFTNSLTGYVSMDFGYDSNVSSIIALDGGYLVAGNTLLLFDESAESKSDNFFRLAGGITSAYGLGNDFFVFGGLDAYEKKNQKEDRFDATLMSLFGGVGFDYGQQRFTLPLYYQKFLLGHNAYLDRFAISADWQYLYSSDAEFGASLSYGAHKFDYLQERDVDNVALIIGWKKHLKDELNPRLSVNIQFGNDTAKDKIYDQFGRNYTQLDLEASLTVWRDHVPYVTATYRTSTFQADDPLYDETRKDNFYYFELGWRWYFLDSTFARLGYSFTKNDSNLELYTFDRSQYFLGVQYNYF